MFTDLNENTYTDAIKFVTAVGIMTGYADGSFKPDNPVTVAEFCRMIHILGQGKENIKQYNRFNSYYLYDISYLNKNLIDKRYFEDLRYVEMMVESCDKHEIQEKDIHYLLSEPDLHIDIIDAIKIVELFFSNIIYAYKNKNIFNKIKYKMIDKYVIYDEYNFSRFICCELLYEYVLLFFYDVLNAQIYDIKKSLEHWRTNNFNVYLFCNRILKYLPNKIPINEQIQYILYEDSRILNELHELLETLLKIELKTKELINNNRVMEKYGYHYTTLNNLNIMLSKSNQSIKSPMPKITLYMNNASSLNDPQEGMLYQKVIYHRHIKNNEIDNRNSYILSFSKDKDEYLPMWVQYADNGKGCRIEFEIPKEIEMFKVNYMKLGDGIPDIIIYLKEEYSNTKDKVLRRYIKDKLSQVQYYYKDIYYKHENEIRYIKNIFPQYVYEYDFVREGEYFPRLYYKTPYPFPIKSVMLGPKCPNPEQVALYLKRMGVPEVLKSNIKFQ